MRIAADGKRFDVDNLSELGSGEVELIQFLTPDGRRRRMTVNVGEDYVEKAKDMVLSAEVLGTGKIAIYARHKNEDEEKEILDIANNGPGPKSPKKVLRELIDRKGEEK